MSIDKTDNENYWEEVRGEPFLPYEDGAAEKFAEYVNDAYGEIMSRDDAQKILDEVDFHGFELCKSKSDEHKGEFVFVSQDDSTDCEFYDLKAVLAEVRLWNNKNIYNDIAKNGDVHANVTEYHFLLEEKDIEALPKSKREMLRLLNRLQSRLPLEADRFSDIQDFQSYVNIKHDKSHIGFNLINHEESKMLLGYQEGHGYKIAFGENGDLLQIDEVEKITDRVTFGQLLGDAQVWSDDLDEEKDNEILAKIGERLHVMDPEESVDHTKEEKPVRLAPNGKDSGLSEEDFEYVHSDEFRERFGDWEKAYRLENLIQSEPVKTDGKIIMGGKDETEKINALRKDRNIAELKKIAATIGDSVKGKFYTNKDTSDSIYVSGNNIREVSSHNIKDVGQLESIALIPEILENGIFIAESKNENMEKPQYQKFKYLVCGLKINGEDYTVKSDIGVKKDGSCYYDHKLTEIEKGTLVHNLTSLLSGEYQTKAPYGQYDKRLVQICQCLQAPFLTENFEPKKEVVDAVRKGKTIYELSEEKPFTVFTAWKVQDRTALLKKYNPVLDMVYSHHITNHFGLQMFNEREGEKRTVKITGRLTTENVDALLVDAESENAYPHITLSARSGFSPVKTNGEIAAHLNDIEPLSDEVETVFTNFSEKNLAETEPLAKRDVLIKEDDQEIEKEKSSKNATTNFVLEKLAKAGIEVVIDKADFERILASEERLQKMIENKKDNPNELFATHNNENLNNEIDSVKETEINDKDTYINISEKTPFIYQQCGLDEYPVNMYRQKLARAFYLEVEKFGERFTHGHKNEFSQEEVKNVFKEFGNPRYVFNSKSNYSNPVDLYLVGVYDTFDKQGNPMVLSMHYNKNRREIEANWVTAIYGKKTNILVEDWTKKSLLVYMNDLEMEKAPAEVVTLHMRVSKSASAYENNIIRKSQIVNDFGVKFFIQNNITYGFTHDNKIYLNPDVMNSEAVVHEYTHLWDEYTKRTNPDLWQKGKDIFSKTHLWKDVKNDPAYADISDDDDLVLSECHARICGKIAEKVLEHIATQDGEIVRDMAIHWNSEVVYYLQEEFGNILEEMIQNEPRERHNAVATTIAFAKAFFGQPMKDLMNGKNITKETEKQKEAFMENEKFVLTESFWNRVGKESEEENRHIQNIIKALEENAAPEIKGGLRINGIQRYVPLKIDATKVNYLVEYEGDISEDGLFNILAEQNMWDEKTGLQIDVNPITPEKSGTIDEYLARLEQWRKEDMEKSKNTMTADISEIQTKGAKLAQWVFNETGMAKDPFSIKKESLPMTTEEGAQIVRIFSAFGTDINVEDVDAGRIWLSYNGETKKDGKVFYEDLLKKAKYFVNNPSHVDLSSIDDIPYKDLVKELEMKLSGTQYVEREKLPTNTNQGEKLSDRTKADILHSDSPTLVHLAQSDTCEILPKESQKLLKEAVAHELANRAEGAYQAGYQKTKDTRIDSGFLEFSEEYNKKAPSKMELIVLDEIAELAEDEGKVIYVKDISQPLVSSIHIDYEGKLSESKLSTRLNFAINEDSELRSENGYKFKFIAKNENPGNYIILSHKNDEDIDLFRNFVNNGLYKGEEILSKEAAKMILLEMEESDTKIGLGDEQHALYRIEPGVGVNGVAATKENGIEGFLNEIEEWNDEIGDDEYIEKDEPDVWRDYLETKRLVDETKQNIDWYNTMKQPKPAKEKPDRVATLKARAVSATHGFDVEKVLQESKQKNEPEKNISDSRHHER